MCESAVWEIAFCDIVITVTTHDHHGVRNIKKYPNTLIADEIICNTEIAFCNIVNTVTPHEPHGVRNHRPLDNLLNSMPWLRAKEISK